MNFDGATYSPSLDLSRLESQLERVRELMLDSKWRTLDEIHRIVGGSEAGISARLRDLRKPRFGSYQVNRRRRGDATAGLFEYRLLKPEPQPRFDFDEQGQGVFA